MENEGGANSLIRVAVVASALSMRLGLRALLTTDPGIIVNLEGSSLDDLENRLSRIDILLLAGRVITSHRLERTLGLLDPGVGILFLVEDPLPRGFREAIGLRAWGVLPIESIADELVAAARALRAGLWVASPELVNPLFSPTRLSIQSEDEAVYEDLSPREIEVLQLVAQGLANKQIAGLLKLSENTVKFHISSIYTKLRAGNRAEAVRLGARRGWISL